MNYTRRHLLKTAIFSTALYAVPNPVWAVAREKLFIPPLMETKRGKPIFLSMETTRHTFLAHKTAEVWGFNGQYLGPTIHVRQGDFVKLNYRNNLPQAVAMNVQGLQVSGELLGGIRRVLKPTETWSPILPIQQPAATCWYQACTLAHSAYQTYRGLAGLWIIEDDQSRKASLPNKYGVDDIPLLLQDVNLNKQGVQLFEPQQHQLFGEHLLVNGQIAPYVNVPRGWVRLRLVNGSLSRTYQIGCDDEREMQVIAQDQGFLPQAQKVKTIQLAPSERIELLLDLNDGGNVRLIAGQPRHFLSKLTALFSQEDLLDNTVLELRPEGLAAVFQSEPTIQFNTDAVNTLSQKISQQRTFHFDSHNGTINQQYFDPKRIDVNAKLGSVEHWTLTSSTPMAFRIQGAKFIVKQHNEQPTEDSQLVWKDTVWIEGKVEILVKFEQNSSNNFPFTFGSANLLLADKGCIGLIVVQ